MNQELKPKREPRKKPKITLLQIFFGIAALGMVIVMVYQHGGF